MKLRHQKYTLARGLEKIKTKTAIMISAVSLIVGSGGGLAFAVLGTTHADASSYSLTPWTYVGAAGDCGNGYPAGTQGGVVSQWDSSAGNPAPSLLLEKNVPTTDCSSAGATVNGVNGITLSELNFDVNGYCSAGAPRFNVVTTDNVTHFFGCAYGTHTDAGNGWTHVVLSPSEGFPAVSSGETVQSIDLVMDEQGSTNLDNVSVNGQVIAGPVAPTSKDQCKNSGWMTATDANGGSFKNQGACVSYVELTTNPGHTK